MSDFDQDFDTRGTKPPCKPTWQVTGRTVLYCLLGFFGVVFAANGVLIVDALSTFGGVETESAYQAGRRFETDVAMVKAQDARQWRVDAKLTPSSVGTVRLDIDARDATGAALRGMEAAAVFERPTDRRLDRSITVAADGSGHFHGSADVPAGQWDLVIELARQGDVLFRSKNRIIVR